MKNRILCMILAFSMIFSNCSSPLLAIAEDGTESETTSTDKAETVLDTTENTTDEAESESDTTNPTEEPVIEASTENTDETEETTTETSTESTEEPTMESTATGDDSGDDNDSTGNEESIDLLNEIEEVAYIDYEAVYYEEVSRELFFKKEDGEDEKKLSVMVFFDPTLSISKSEVKESNGDNLCFFYGENSENSVLVEDIESGLLWENVDGFKFTFPENSTSITNLKIGYSAEETKDLTMYYNYPYPNRYEVTSIISDTTAPSIEDIKVYADHIEFKVSDGDGGSGVKEVTVNNDDKVEEGDDGYYTYKYKDTYNGIEIIATDNVSNQKTITLKDLKDAENNDLVSYQYQDEKGNWVDIDTEGDSDEDGFIHCGEADCFRMDGNNIYANMDIRININEEGFTFNRGDTESGSSYTILHDEDSYEDSYNLVATKYDNDNENILLVYPIGNVVIDKIPPTTYSVSVKSKEITTVESKEITTGETNHINNEQINNDIVISASDSGSGVYKFEAKIGETSYEDSDQDGEIRIPISDFEEKQGDYDLIVTVKDNAGNPDNPDENALSVTFDFEPPSGTIAVDDDSYVIIDGEYWFDMSDPISFKFHSDNEDAVSVTWTINDEESAAVDLEDGEYILSPSQNNGQDGGYTSTIGDDHKYKVSAIFYDEAENASETVTLEVHKDCEAPTIQCISVEKKETAADKILRVLTFGIYANDKVDVKIFAYDAVDDSGLDEGSFEVSIGDETNDTVTSSFNEGIKEKDMPKKNENENEDTDEVVIYSDTGEVEEIPEDVEIYCYTVTIPGEDKNLQEEAFEGNISVTVKDKYLTALEENNRADENDKSNHSTFVPAAADNLKSIMIEQNNPVVSVTLDDSDGNPRDDGQIWYNKNHGIIITAQDKESGINNIKVEVLSNNNEWIEYDEYTEYKEAYTDEVSYTLNTDEIAEELREQGGLPQNGCYEIKVIVTDNAGNSDDATVTYYIDKISPVINSIDFSIPSADNDIDASNFIEILEYGFYFETDLIATVNISDEGPSSELYKLEYTLVSYDNGVRGEETKGIVDIIDGQASFAIPAHFKGQIYVKGFDNVGNESVEVTPQSFVIDTPERHEAEEHIIISGLGTSDYKDAEGHILFDSSVNLSVTIIDTMSGIRDISYAISSEQDTQDNQTIIISNTGNYVGQDLGDGWTITAMDENLVTEVTRNYTFSADNNTIQLTFSMTDRANNTSDKTSDIFSIDQTAPVIDVVFNTPAGNSNYYRENRTATITVIDRNFDASRIRATITNEIGNVPALSFTNNSATEHVAVLNFSEGDYTFAIEGTDRANHTATVNYSGGNEKNFHVDMTNPAVIDNFDQFINALNNSFNIDKEMTFTITEHNFTASLVNIKIYRTEAGNELNTENREDCTAEYVSADKWESNGDKHSIRFKFSEDYIYQVSLNVTDASGRTCTTKTSPVFEIDKTAPVLKTPTNLDVLIFTDKNTEATATPLEFFDANIASVHYSVVSYQMKRNEDNVGYDMNVDSEEFDITSDSVVISNEYFNQDGIYEVKSVAYDIAGNASEETTHTFVIQRDTDFLVYIPNSDKEKQTGLYKFNEKGIRSADFSDIEIITYITQDKELEIQVDGTVVEDSDLDVSKDSRKINQISMYDVTLKSSYIAQNYDAETIDTDLTLNAVATSGDAEQVITLGHIYIDNVKPVGEYESALQNLGTFDGFYGMESRTVLIEGVSPDIDLDRCEIQVNDDTLTYEQGGYDYDENTHTISFTIEKGYTDIRPTLVDLAGNINNLPIKKGIYVGSLFGRFWYLFILGGLVILFIPIFIIMTLIRKKKTMHNFN